MLRLCKANNLKKEHGMDDNNATKTGAEEDENVITIQLAAPSGLFGLGSVIMWLLLASAQAPLPVPQRKENGPSWQPSTDVRSSRSPETCPADIYATVLR